MSRGWEERVYEVVIAAHPRIFRTLYGEACKLMLNDMLKDPSVPRWRVWLAILDDLANMLRGGVRLGLVFGLLVLAIVFARRAFEPVGFYLDPNVALLLIGFVYALAGFTGARRYGFLRGVGVGVVAGAVSALAFATDPVGRQFTNSEAFVGIIVMSIAEGMSLVVLGAIVATFGDLQRRVRRSAVAFGSAWLRE